MSNQFEIRNPLYLESFKPFRNSQSLNQIADSIKGKIDSKNNARCLDSMAGTGIVGKKMKEIFPNISIIYQDFSEKMLFSEFLSGENTMFSDSKTINVKDNFFDIVFCRGGLNNVPENEYVSIIKEYIRVIYDDGIVVIQDHFAQTREQKEIINQIESEIAKLEGRTDETHIPTIDELENMIKKEGGKIKKRSVFEIELSLKDRFASKGIFHPDLSQIKSLLEKQSALKYEIKEEDVILKYPITTLVFGKTIYREKINTKIYEILNKNPIKKGFRFLETENQKGFFPSYTNDSRENPLMEKQAPKEIFSSAVIAHALLDNKLNNSLLQQLLEYLMKQTHNGLVTFFENSNLIVPDSDSNALIFSVLLESGYIENSVAHTVLDKILEYTNSDGIIQTWLSNNKHNKIDHVVIANVLYLANLLKRSDECKKSEEFIIKQIKSEEYLKGSRYYHSPESFLFFVSKLMRFSEVKEKIENELRNQVVMRMGKTQYPLDLAMRIICAKLLGIKSEGERKILLEIQEENGAWPFDSLYKEGSNPKFYGNKSIPTVLAMKALAMEE